MVPAHRNWTTLSSATRSSNSDPSTTLSSAFDRGHFHGEHPARRLRRHLPALSGLFFPWPALCGFFSLAGPRTRTLTLTFCFARARKRGGTKNSSNNGNNNGGSNNSKNKGERESESKREKERSNGWREVGAWVEGGGRTVMLTINKGEGAPSRARREAAGRPEGRHREPKRTKKQNVPQGRFASGARKQRKREP